MSDFFTAMRIAGSGLAAERVRMNVVASNLANANTTRTEGGGPYQRKDPIFRAVAVSDQEPAHQGERLASNMHQ